MIIVSGLACMVAGCSKSAPSKHSHEAAVPADTTVPLHSDLGSWHHEITTSSPKAQQYFDQGLRFVFAFNHDEAIRAFNAAIALDSICAMCYWGVALALAPNINMPMDTSQGRQAFLMVQHSQARQQHATDRERAYIAALATRYAKDPPVDRASLDSAYANAMRELSRKYPDDLDAATLFAESMLDLRPWNQWKADGTPQPGTEEVVTVLESVLRRSPDHPGACHYYIHTIEGSSRPDRGLVCADKLPNLMPGAGHIVHMPAHIYMRTGRYDDAIKANAQAASVDSIYIAKYRPAGVYPMMYYPHNIHFLWAAAVMDGRSAESLKAARDAASKASEDMVRSMPPLEFLPAGPILSLVRFGNWDAVLKEPPPPQDFLYVRGIWHYARGYAYAAKGQYDDAIKSRDSVLAIAKTVPADQIVGTNNSAVLLLDIAANTLTGEIAVRRGQTDAAVKALTAAVALQDQLHYDEPTPWYYPVRQSLGAALLLNRRPKEAEAVYRTDLAKNPNNGWSLYGLRESLKAQGRTAEADSVSNAFNKAWARSDVTLKSSRF